MIRTNCRLWAGSVRPVRGASCIFIAGEYWPITCIGIDAVHMLGIAQIGESEMSGIQRMFANVVAVSLLAVSAGAAAASTTLQNMQTAFNGESNAHK